MTPSSKTPENDSVAEPLQQDERPWDEAAIDAIVERFAALRVLDTRSDDEIIGYDENGLPG